MRRLGAESYVSNLVGVTEVREMAPLMTAIVMSGRTGSSYAAEISHHAGYRGNRCPARPRHPHLRLLILPRARRPDGHDAAAVSVCCNSGSPGRLCRCRLHYEYFCGQLHDATSRRGHGIRYSSRIGESVAFGSWIAIASCQIGLKCRPQCDGRWPCGHHGCRDGHRGRHCARRSVRRVCQRDRDLRP